MVLFLTSDIGIIGETDGNLYPVCLNEENGMVGRLKKYWKNGTKMLFLTAAPDDYENNDGLKDAFGKIFPMSGLSLDRVEICDGRDEGAVSRIGEYDALLFGGGHVPTQNAFFKKIGLRQALSGYGGIVMALSAGSMNCAETVYAIPELPGEGTDMDYRRFLGGLGLTKRMIIPHYQWLESVALDGMRVIEDIAVPDSFGREFIALHDGSYILSENGRECVYGEAGLIRDGKITKLCSRNKSVCF